jgi:hypothetical protein
MTGQAQIAANRCNATTSTGPRTPAGKAAVARNGIKHGFLSRECLVKGESEADLVGFGKRLRAQLAPVGELELLLADRIVATAWRLRRAGTLETKLLNDRSDSKGMGVLANVFPWDTDREKIQLLSRYEVTLERSLYRALHELQRLQGAREGRAVPLPAAVDVDISVSGPDEASEMALLGKNKTIDGKMTSEASGN